MNRRTSITQNLSNNSPSARPGARQRESGGDLLSGNPLSSPTSNSRFSKDESSVTSPPPSLLRRKTDFKDGFGPSLDEKEKEPPNSPFGSLKRTSTNPVSAGLNGPSSPWSAGPQSAGFSTMGAFGSFALGGQAPVTGEKKPGFGSTRGESRFKGLMNAGSSEDIRSKVKERTSIGNLERLAETSEQPHSRWAGDRNSQTRPANQDLYADDEDFGTGSAALGGDGASPPFPQGSRYKNPDRQTSYDEIGFSSLGLSSDVPPFRELMQRRDPAHQQAPQRHQGMGQIGEPMSPTTTNPYQSPEGEKAVLDEVDADEPDFQHMPYGQSARGFPAPLDGPKGDRSQTSSVGPGRGFPNLGNLGNLGGFGSGASWSAAPGAIGTPSRAQPGFSGGFGDPNFGGLNDMASPQSGLGSSNAFSVGGSSTMGNTSGPVRGSKLSSLLPTAMQDQMRGDMFRQDQVFGENADNQAPGFGLRETRGAAEDLFSNNERGRGLQGITSPFANSDSSQQVSISAPSQTPFSSAPSTASYFGRSQEPDAASNQMPATQQRQMVMPDRMRWIYRDPQGNMQGPWSGLEMHDWYKAGFFSPELQVKKLEDGDYEPLAQLIRRIGNSREPFLVPQIGIPHGPPTALPNSSSVTAASVAATTPSTAQPPFASSFPSFGTTLSAEQQNALERRKQEEQYLMARQKEHLAQQQVMLKQMHMQSGQLHHHSSAHSLQSQPSYGSITSPMGYQPSPAQGPIQPPGPVSGFFDGSSRVPGPLGTGIDPLSSVREEDLPGFMERLGMGRGAQPPYGSENQNHPQHVAAIMQERARQDREQHQYLQQRGDEDQRVTADRLEQYHQLRAQEDHQNYQPQAQMSGQATRRASELDLTAQQQRIDSSDFRDAPQLTQNEQRSVEPLSLSEQVQQAAAKQPATQPQSPWAKVDAGLPQPFPPPQSMSPMPAPTPQRNRQSVADALNAESQSPSNADSIETPSAAPAPWAKERDEVSKGPSLKEIQAMETKKAAQQEEIAAAARRAVAEQERQNQHSQPIAPAPGLPSSANWASSISPAIPTTTGASPWAKPATGKAAVATPVTGAKKTLAQIQKEEENKKNRQAAAQAAAAATLASTAAPIAGGKRYADLASKPTPLAPQGGNAAWTTVGAGGKVKTPTTPAPGVTTRTASGGIVQPSATASKPKPSISTAAKGPANQQHASEEFQKWTKSALSKGLNPNIPGK